MDLPKAYNPKEVEDKIYKLWEESGFFTPERRSKIGIFGIGNFTTVMAPPNITGELHMGHALEYILQDIIVRMKRMQGYRTLWVPGFDHAGIATQNIVEKELKKEGLTRHDLGKEKFLERVWQWKAKSQTLILNQFKKMGLSADWSKIRFTMDENYTKAVYQAFNHYKMKGWIYQGWRVINWCPRCQSAISDLEVEHKETKGKLYFIRYPLAVPQQAQDANDYIVVATTRPETMLGDSAVAVNPNDERYKDLIGKMVRLPIQNREIPIITDDAIDMTFGTGALKVTPAHSIDDFEISQRHNLKVFEVIDKNGKMTKEAGQLCERLTTKECRNKVVEKLRELNLLEKEEDLTHNVGYCSRCNTIIEPLYSKQWFLKMGELAKKTHRELSADRMLPNSKIKFHPEHWRPITLRWLENIKDWNISRQLWWGHPIPDSEDVLDTWFSSALWPFAALGWPDKNNPYYKTHYPIQFITSGRDILFLWITRMIFSGLELTDKYPFKEIYLHATVLTKDGRRMSKSKGVGVDPLNLIEEYGTDALRFGLAFQTTGLQDMKFNEDVILMGKKFANKLWNIARYILMKVGPNYNFSIKNMPDKLEKQITEKMNFVISSATKEIENYEFGDAAHRIYDFVWHDFADKYIEETKNKDDNETKDSLIYLLANSLKLLHPFMPFITEEIWSKLPIKNKKMLLVESWPH